MAATKEELEDKDRLLAKVEKKSIKLEGDRQLEKAIVTSTVNSLHDVLKRVAKKLQTAKKSWRSF